MTAEPDTPATITLPAPSSPPGLTKGAALCAFEGGGATLKLVATGDVRRALNELGPALRDSAQRVRVWSCASLLEAELMWLREAPSRTPLEWGPVAEKLSPWCVALDGGDAARLVSRRVERWPDPGTAGLFIDKAGADRYARCIGLLAGACRYSSVVRATHDRTAADAMLDDHRSALAGALTWTGETVGELLRRAEADMVQAAADQEFERAAALKAAVDLGSKIPAGRLTHVGPADEQAWVVVAPEPGDASRRRVLVMDHTGRWRAVVGEADPDEALVGTLLRQIPESAPTRASLAALGTMVRAAGAKRSKHVRIDRIDPWAIEKGR